LALANKTEKEPAETICLRPAERVTESQKSRVRTAFRKDVTSIPLGENTASNENNNVKVGIIAKDVDQFNAAKEKLTAVLPCAVVTGFVPMKSVPGIRAYLKLEHCEGPDITATLVVTKPHHEDIPEALDDESPEVVFSFGSFDEWVPSIEPYDPLGLSQIEDRTRKANLNPMDAPITPAPNLKEGGADGLLPLNAEIEENVAATTKARLTGGRTGTIVANFYRILYEIPCHRLEFVNQADIVRRTCLSKTTVSNYLQMLSFVTDLQFKIQKVLLVKNNYHGMSHWWMTGFVPPWNVTET